MSGPRLSRSTPVARLPLLVAGLLAIAAGIAIWSSHLLSGAEQSTVGARFDMAGAQSQRDVAVVGVDDASFQALALQWPFPRRLHARAIRNLRGAGARGIVYDVQFTEPSKAADDTALYGALGPDVVLATSQTDGHGHTNVLGGDANLARRGARAASAVLEGAGSQLTRFHETVGGLATIAVTAARRLAGRDVAAIPPAGALIDFRGPPGTIPSLSFADVVRGRFDRALVRGRIVVVGATAATVQDLHAVPTSSGQLMSGAELEANAIWTALHGNPLRDASTALTLALIVLLGALVPVLCLFLRTRVALLGALVAAITYALSAYAAFRAGLVLEVIAPLTALAFGTLGALAVLHGAEWRLRAQTSRRNEDLERHVRERTDELRLTQLEIVQRLGRVAERRDSHTGAHIGRMSSLCERLALAAGMSPAEAELLRDASSMHDIGKVGLPDDLLLKPGAYSPDERGQMQAHAALGAEILSGSPSPLLQTAEQIALSHHERWDGGGYPAGLAGEAIPIAGRICAICDVFDALISERPYKAAWSVDRALAEIEREAGSHFDPALVVAFMTLADDLRTSGSHPATALRAA